MPTDVESIILDEIREIRKEMKVVLHDMDLRLRSIEADRNRAVGVIAFVSVIFGSIGACLFKVFCNK